MLRRRMLMSALVAALACGTLAASPADARRGGDDDQRGGKTEGTLTAVNANATPPTVTINRLTLKITPTTKIEVNDRHADLDDLEVGARAEAEYDRSTLNAFKVETEGDGTGGNDDEDVTETGRIINADPATGRVTFDRTGDGAADVTFTTDANTDIEVQDRRIGRSELALLNGLQARVEYFTGSLYAKEIHAVGSSKAKVRGKVAAVDAAARVIRVTTASGERTFAVAAGAKIQVNRRKASLAQVPVGANAELEVVTTGNGPLVTEIEVGKTSKQNRGRGQGQGRGRGRGRAAANPADPA